MPARRLNTCLAEVSLVVRSASGSFARAASSGTLRHRKEGTSVSSTVFSAAGTPALRKYFWARMSQATWLHASGTSIPVCWKTTEPSGLRISLVAWRNAMSAYGSWPALVNRRSMRMAGAPFFPVSAGGPPRRRRGMMRMRLADGEAGRACGPASISGAGPDNGHKIWGEARLKCLPAARFSSCARYAKR